MGDVSLSGIQAIEDDWFSASQALACAQAEISRAMAEYRRDSCDSTRARLACAIETRDAAILHLRTLMHAVWDCAA